MHYCSLSLASQVVVTRNNVLDLMNSRLPQIEQEVPAGDAAGHARHCYHPPAASICSEECISSTQVRPSTPLPPATRDEHCCSGRSKHWQSSSWFLYLSIVVAKARAPPTTTSTTCTVTITGLWAAASAPTLHCTCTYRP